MTMSLLEICTEALEEIGVDPPSAISSGDDLGRQLLALANSTGRNLAMRGDWEDLKTEGTFTSLATELQFSFSASFPHYRKILPHTMWNRSRQEPLIGPLSSQAWQRIKSDSFTPVFPTYYIRAGKLYFPGEPTAGEEIYFEYLDKRWCSSSDGVTLKERMTADTDIPLIDDHALVLGIRWRFLQRKGLEYGEAFREFEDWVAERLGADTPSETLSMNPRSRRGYSAGGEGSWFQNNGLTWDATTLSWG